MAKLSPQIHIEQAKLNAQAATNAAQSGDNDWAVTMCFYSALHYVKAYSLYKNENIYLLYCDKSKPNTEHQRILDYVLDISYDNESDRGKSYQAYETLYNASMTSRYLKNITITARKNFNSDINKYFEHLKIVEMFFVINDNAIINPATQRPNLKS